MIISKHREQLFLVTQSEHSELVGQIASQWGSDSFARADPYRSMVVLASEHDHAWAGEDNQPSYNEADRCPHDYITLPYHLHTAIYQKGTRDTAMHDSYAGLLLSMHGLGIYNERFDTDPGQLRPIRNEEEGRVVERYINEEESFQAKLKTHVSKLDGFEEYGTDSHIWTNYLLMQVWDRLGLLLCKRTESDFQLSPVPISYELQNTGKIEFAWQGDNLFAVSPYPFAKEEMTFYFKGRYLPDVVYWSQQEYHDAYYSTLREPVQYTFIPG